MLNNIDHVVYLMLENRSFDSIVALLLTASPARFESCPARSADLGDAQSSV